MTEKGDLISEESLNAVKQYKFSLKGKLCYLLKAHLKLLLVKVIDPSM